MAVRKSGVPFVDKPHIFKVRGRWSGWKALTGPERAQRNSTARDTIDAWNKR